jgi:hypothetical protein
MSALLEALRTRSPLPTVNEHRTAHGCVGVTLGELAVLANYTVDGFDTIELHSISVSGYSVPPECFSPEQRSEWVREIAADRAEDDRIAADAAEYARWEQAQ